MSNREGRQELGQHDGVESLQSGSCLSLATAQDQEIMLQAVTPRRRAPGGSGDAASAHGCHHLPLQQRQRIDTAAVAVTPRARI
jgi:hypothetical protein